MFYSFLLSLYLSEGRSRMSYVMYLLLLDVIVSVLLGGYCIVLYWDVDFVMYEL